MVSIRQAVDFIIWWRKEALGLAPTATIYNQLARTNKYDPTIDYPQRVARFARIFTQLSIRPKHVLDLACGTGAMIDAMPWKHTAHIVGLDISAGMLAVARKRFATLGNIQLKHKSFLELDVAPSSCDLVTMTYATRFVPLDHERYLAQSIARILRPGGLFIAVTGEDIFPWINLPLSHLTGLPRGHNLQMNYSGYLQTLFTPLLPLAKFLILDREALIFRHVALVFQKPRS